MTTDLTLRQKILLAAVALAAEREPFTVEDLVVSAWRLYPEAFSLRGYGAEHPDAARVQPKLAGVDGLCALGWLESGEERSYRLTRKGRTVAEKLRGLAAAPVDARPPKPRRQAAPPPPVSPRPTPPPPTPPPPLSDEDCARVRRVATADALRKFLRGSPLTFADACVFWGVSQKHPRGVRERLRVVEELLKRVVDSLGVEGATDLRLPALSSCYGVLNLHRLMLGRFARELDALAAQGGAAT